MIRLRFPAIAWTSVLLAAFMVLMSAIDAEARFLYVVNSGDGTVSIVNSRTGQLVGHPLSVGANPGLIAMSADGKVAVVSNTDANSVSIINAQTNEVVGSVSTGLESRPFAVAISPDGSRAFVANSENDSVSVIDTSSHEVIGSPIAVGTNPVGIALSPDAKIAYVANGQSKNLSLIDTETREKIGLPIPLGGSELDSLAITPDGTTLFVGVVRDKVLAFDTQTKEVVGSPITVGNAPQAIVFSPDGNTAYVANAFSDSVSVIDVPRREVVGSPLPVGKQPEGVAVSPDGKLVYVSTRVPGMPGVIWVIDAQAKEVLGSKVGVGKNPEGIAIAPLDLPPSASFAASQTARVGAPISFDASHSTDADGAVASLAWDFGDGTMTSAVQPVTDHAFRLPGSYDVTLTATDDEGCSTSRLLAGSTVLCEGSAAAKKANVLRVNYPMIRVSCPAKAGPKGCHFEVRAVTKKRHGKAETAVSRARVKARHSGNIPLKAKPQFLRLLGTAGAVLVEETVRVGGTMERKVRRLAIH